MLPLILDISNLNILVCGNGYATGKRLEMLDKCGAKNVTHIKEQLTENDIENINIVYIADFDDDISGEMAKIVRNKNGCQQFLFSF